MGRDSQRCKAQSKHDLKEIKAQNMIYKRSRHTSLDRDSEKRKRNNYR